MSRFAIERVWEVLQRAWLDSDYIRLKTAGVTLDRDSFSAFEDEAGNRGCPSGIPVGILSPNGKYGPALRHQAVVGTEADPDPRIVFTMKRTGGQTWTVQITTAAAAHSVTVDTSARTIVINNNSGDAMAAEALVEWLNEHANAAAFQAVCHAELFDTESEAGVIVAVGPVTLQGGRDADYITYTSAILTDHDAEVAVMDWGRVIATAMPYFQTIPRPEGPNGERWLTLEAEDVQSFVEQDGLLAEALPEMTFVVPADADSHSDFDDVETEDDIS